MPQMSTFDPKGPQPVGFEHRVSRERHGRSRNTAQPRTAIRLATLRQIHDVLESFEDADLERSEFRLVEFA